jgi:hypothetical protein
MPPHKKTKVIHRKLGKEQAWGQAHIEANKIEIDERVKSYRYMLLMVHEKLHLIFPDWSETKIKQTATKMSKFLWENNFRWVDLQ